MSSRGKAHPHGGKIYLKIKEVLLHDTPSPHTLEIS